MEKNHKPELSREDREALLKLSRRLSTVAADWSKTIGRERIRVKVSLAVKGDQAVKVALAAKGDEVCTMVYDEDGNSVCECTSSSGAMYPCDCDTLFMLR